MQGLRVLLLGPPRLELDGQALTRLIAAKHQALVFHLAAEGRPVPRGRLAGLLWGDLDDESAARPGRSVLASASALAGWKNRRLWCRFFGQGSG